MSRDECRKYLRYLELDAYAKMVSALRAQGPLTEGKQKLLGDLANALHIPNERHKAEIRRAVNDDRLALIAEQIFGPNNDTEWTVEGRRMIPLFPRLKGRTAYTTIANSIALTTAIANERQPPRTRKQEAKYKIGSHCHSKYDEKLLNNDDEVPFISKKRKRMSHEVGVNNGSINYPSTSYNQITLKSVNSTKSFLSAQPTHQSTTNRQRIDSDKSEQSYSHEHKDFRIVS